MEGAQNGDSKPLNIPGKLADVEAELKSKFTPKQLARIDAAKAEIRHCAARFGPYGVIATVLLAAECYQPPDDPRQKGPKVPSTE